MNNNQLSANRLKWIWLLLAAVLTLLASGRWTLAPAAWIAPVFALRYLDILQGQKRAWRGVLLLYGALWLALSVAWYGATPMFGAAHFVFMAVNAFVGLLPLLADYWLTPRLARTGRLPFVTTLIFPTATTALEYVMLGSSPFGNFGAAGYSQFAFTPFVQVGAWGGMLLQAFLLAWLPAVLVWLWRCADRSDFAWRGVRGALTFVAAVYLLLLGGGALRLALAPVADNRVPVAAFTLASPDFATLFGQLDANPDALAAAMQPQHAAYLARTATEAVAGAKIILWPEAAVIGREAEVNAMLAAGAELAQQYAVYLAMPTFTVYPGEQRAPENRLIVIDPTGAIVINHVKYGGNIIEGSLKGSGELQTVETPYGTLSAVICWDTDFPNIVRQAGQQGVDILLSPARDWAGISVLHGQMTPFRAVENGLSVIRQADSGLSLVSDPYGRALATLPAGSTATLLAAVPTAGVATLYPRIGDGVGLASLVVFVALAGWALLAGRRARALQTPPLAGRAA